MSNSYTKAAFGLAVTSAEADLLRRVIAVIQLIGDADVSIEALEALEAHYGDIGPDFAALFPRTELSPFDSLLDLFPDESYPILDFDVAFGEPDEAGQIVGFFSGEQFGVETAAKLIQRCPRSALPFGFEFAFDADKLRAGELGGGYVAITEAANFDMPIADDQPEWLAMPGPLRF